MEIVGKCRRCGREFVKMPIDGIDHFASKHDRYIPCNGIVDSIKPSEVLIREMRDEWPH